MIKKLIIALIAINCFLIQGCVSFNTLAEAKNAKGYGSSQSFSSGKDDVWNATLRVVERSNLSLVVKDEEQGMILAQQPFNPFGMTAGQNVAIYVSDDFGKTNVEVISRKAVGEIEFVSKNWEKYILKELGQSIN